jgi:hypothetical protein
MVSDFNRHYTEGSGEIQHWIKAKHRDHLLCSVGRMHQFLPKPTNIVKLWPDTVLGYRCLFVLRMELAYFDLQLEWRIGTKNHMFLIEIWLILGSTLNFFKKPTNSRKGSPDSDKY